MTKPGPKPSPHSMAVTLSLRLHRDLMLLIETRAARLEMSRSDYVRTLIEIDIAKNQEH